MPNRHGVEARRFGEAPQRSGRLPVEPVGDRDPRLEFAEFIHILLAAAAEDRRVGCLGYDSAAAGQPLLEVGRLPRKGPEDLQPHQPRVLEGSGELASGLRCRCRDDLPVIAVVLPAILRLPWPGVVSGCFQPPSEGIPFPRPVAVEPRLGHPAEIGGVCLPLLEPAGSFRPLPAVTPADPAPCGSGPLVARIVVECAIEQRQGFAGRAGQRRRITVGAGEFLPCWLAVECRRGEHGMLERARRTGPPGGEKIIPDRPRRIAVDAGRRVDRRGNQEGYLSPLGRG